MPTFIEKQYKSIINKLKYIDNWFWARYTINPYNGCQFGCTYCDARSEHYHMPEDFENQIVIKQNIGPMLDKRIARARTFLPDVVVIGGVTDGYQPAEKKYENTRQLLKVLANRRYPVHIITKSTLVARDLDLLEAIGQQTWCSVSITITTTDPETAKFVDYRAPSPDKRLDTLEKIKTTAPHVQSGVLLIPLIPYLCDSEESMRSLADSAKASGADYLLFGGGMSLRNVQAGWFLGKLKNHFPEIFEKYKKLYGFTKSGKDYDGRHYPPGNYLLEKNTRLLSLCKEFKLPHRMRRFIPLDYRQTNYQIAEMLLNEAYNLQMAGRPWETLFWAGQNIQELKESIEAVHARGELGTIRNVRGNIKTRVEKLLS